MTSPHSSRNKISVIGVFDIGKTNKKIFLFDEGYKIIYERTTQLPEIIDEDGFPCEDIEALTHWVKEEFDRIQNLDHVNIKAINISAYGASFVYLDQQGRLIGHLYNYLKPFPEKILQAFHSKFDPDHRLSLQTASPQLGSLNSGLQLYRLKYEKPDFYNTIKYSLHLPQYISFLLTGKFFSELTSLGCHTMLWDFSKKDYHEWVIQEGLSLKFPKIVSCDHVEIKNGIKIGAGLHDSSAALIPYLKSFPEPFVLISTGTWCISLNPFNQNPLTKEELEADSLQYISYEGCAVKAARLFAGHEHEQMIKKIASHFSVQQEYLSGLEFDPKIAATLIKQEPIIRTNRGVEKMQSSGFDQRDLSPLKSFEEAYHQLLIDIVRQQVASTNLVLKGSTVKKIFIDGGFAKNSIFMNLLAAGFPQYEIYHASVHQASALGAALAIHKSWNTKAIPLALIELRLCKRPDGIEIHPIV